MKRIVVPLTLAVLGLAISGLAGAQELDDGTKCVDLNDRDGKLYDVDFVVGKTEANDSLTVREVYLHKVEGKAVSK